MKKFTKARLSHQVADQINSMIREKNWPVGVPLPPARELAKEFGVCLVTAQDAMRKLAQAGVVELRARQGAFVKTSQPEVERVNTSRHVAVVNFSYPTDSPDYPEGFGVEGFFQGIDMTLGQRDYHMTTFFYDWAQNDVLGQVLPRIDRIAEGLAGVIVYARPETIPLIKELDARGIPCVTINTPRRGSMCNFVAADNEEGGWRVGKCLLGMGIRRVLCMHMRGCSQASMEKISGVFQAYVESFTPTDGIQLIEMDGDTEKAGYRAINRYLADSPVRPQVIFGMSDYMAVGAIRALQEQGLKVPDEIGVIGATGLNIGVSAHPELTTLVEPMREIGRSAAQMLLEMVENKVRKLPGRRIPSPIIFRESVKVSPELQKELEQIYRAQVEEFTDGITLGAGKIG
jgi:DNA-binding LacI/PurR family transcriptional regulator/DNA-binding transcriptional regulator YhcF (GntR family)